MNLIGTYSMDGLTPVVRFEKNVYSLAHSTEYYVYQAAISNEMIGKKLPRVGDRVEFYVLGPDDVAMIVRVVGDSQDTILDRLIRLEEKIDTLYKLVVPR